MNGPTGRTHRVRAGWARGTSLQLQSHRGHGHRPPWAQAVNTPDTHLLLHVSESEHPDSSATFNPSEAGKNSEKLRP